MEDHRYLQQAAPQAVPQENNERTIKQTVVIPEGSYVTKDLPATPTTTISAILGPGPALEQEIASRAVAESLHAEAHARIKERQPRQSTKENIEKSEKSPSPFRKALKNLNPRKKKGKHSAKGENVVDVEDNHRRASEDAYDDCRGIYVRQPVPGVPQSTLLSPYATQPARQLFVAPPQQFNNTDAVTNEQNMTTPRHQMSYFSVPAPHSPYYDRAESGNYSMTLGGQVSQHNNNRVPSTFLTPTNENTYAIAGRSRLVSGNEVTSHHADIQGTPSQSIQTALPSIFATTPVVHFASEVSENLGQDSQGEDDYNEVIPGVPYSMEYLDAHLDYPGHRTAVTSRATHEKVEMRRSVSVPANMMMRGSALPAPLNIKKNKGIEPEKDEEVTNVKSPMTAQSPGRANDAYWITAFDGIHKHLEDVKGELLGRMERMEEKMDRVLGVLSASAAAAAQQKRKLQQQQQQQREIRSNLTGLPPHVPFGGMEGWYNAVRK